MPLNLTLEYERLTSLTNKQAATITALRAMLKRLEWSGYNNDYGRSFCPSCEGDNPTHATGCKLDALLKERVNMPKRIQRKRSRGWKMPENTVYVGRPSRWGNDNKIGDPYPFIENHLCTLDDVVWLYEVDLKTMDALGTLNEFLAPLRGKDLACWCPLDKPCHADVLLRLANQ